MTPEAPGPGRFKRGAAGVLASLIGLAAALHSFGPGTPPTALDLDPSWTAVLGWAHAEGALFGEELVFTYGPLGFLHPRAAYVEDVYSSFLVGQLVLAALAGWATALLLLRLPMRLQLAYIVAGTVPAAWISVDVVWLLYLAQLPVIVCLPVLTSPAGQTTADWKPWRQLGLVVLGLGAAIAALLKFSLLPVSVTVVLAASTALWIERHRCDALLLASSTLFSYLAIWRVCGQLFDQLPDYFLRSAEVAIGYGGAMGVVPVPGTDALGFASMAAVGGWLGWQMLVERRRPGRALVYLALGTVVFVAWRVGFTRADGHIHLIFPLLAAAPLLGLALMDPRRSIAMYTGFAATALAICVGFHLASSDIPPARWIQSLQRLPIVVRALTRPDALTAERQAIGNQLRAAHPLPRLRARVGTDSVDILNWEQGVVLLHGLNYRPRPVFQSYSAYTPMLQRLNEAHFLGVDAPRFVMVKIQAIDGRFPAGEDALALLAILRRYEPVLDEEGFLLFERGDGPAPTPTRSPVLERALAPGQWMELPAARNPRLLAVDVRLTTMGRIYALWFRTPPIGLEIDTGTGRTEVFRIQPDAIREGLLLSPMLRHTDQLAAIYAGHPPEHVRRVRVVSMSPAYASLFSPDVRIGVADAGWRLPEVAPEELPNLQRGRSPP